MPNAKQPVSINGIEFDALISQEHTMEATIPEYSVEDGFSVSDAIILTNDTLQMVLYVTNTPVTWASRHGIDQNRVANVCDELERLYLAATPVTIVTSDRTYTNMAIESITLSKSVEMGYSREIPISFRKIRTTSAKKTTIPASYGKSGVSSASAGSANTGSGSRSSGSSGGGGSSSKSSGGSSSSKSGGSSSSGGKGSILWNLGKGLFGK